MVKLSIEERLYLQRIMIADYNHIIKTMETGLKGREEQIDKELLESIAVKLLIPLNKEGIANPTKDDVLKTFRE